MNGSGEIDEKHAANLERRRRQIRDWAAYVRSHPDHDWGEQVNTLVDSQIESARHHEGDRPDGDVWRNSPLLEE